MPARRPRASHARQARFVRSGGAAAKRLAGVAGSYSKENAAGLLGGVGIHRSRSKMRTGVIRVSNSWNPSARRPRTSKYRFSLAGARISQAEPDIRASILDAPFPEGLQRRPPKRRCVATGGSGRGSGFADAVLLPGGATRSDSSARYRHRARRRSRQSRSLTEAAAPWPRHFKSRCRS
jgi:hypothetical protein